MNGAQRRLAALLGAGFLVILAVIMVANATSMASDFAAAGVPVTTAHVWLWEVSSIIAWLTLLLPIWLPVARSEEHTSELQSLMRISYAVFCLKKKKNINYDAIILPTTLIHSTTTT